MDLAIRTTEFGPDTDQGFIVKPNDITEVGCTLDLALFGLTDSDTSIPAGTPLGEVTASGVYGPYSDAATDGRQTFAGPLFDTIPTRGKTSGNVGASRIVLGAIYEAKLPTPIDPAAKADMPTIAFV